MNIKLRQKAKNNFEKDCFKLMNNAVFRKNMENVTKHRNINLSQQKGDKIIQYQNQIIMIQSFSKNIYQHQK